ncbi:MAG: hypothetical protein H0V70_25605 [Ktedonobacteraceae bacterium]|nr:hypothetical protein [Ktedonobacteraceae bacterium]
MRREWSLNGTSGQILLIQRLNIDYANPIDLVTFSNIEVQTDLISFDPGKLLEMSVG